MKDQIKSILIDNFICDTQDQLNALIDLIMDQIAQIPLELLTVTKIRKLIEQEITIFMQMRGQL
jgi:hypothetical protein